MCGMWMCTECTRACLSSCVCHISRRVYARSVTERTVNYSNPNRYHTVQCVCGTPSAAVAGRRSGRCRCRGLVMLMVPASCFLEFRFGGKFSISKLLNSGDRTRPPPVPQITPSPTLPRPRHGILCALAATDASQRKGSHILASAFATVINSSWDCRERQ